MKLSAVITAVLLSSACTHYEVIEVPPGPKITFKTAPDPAAHMMLKCDRLGFARGSDGHRLCVMRGVDRLQPTTTHELQLPRTAPIQILPHAFPALVPGNSIFLSK